MFFICLSRGHAEIDCLLSVSLPFAVSMCLVFGLVWDFEITCLSEQNNSCQWHPNRFQPPDCLDPVIVPSLAATLLAISFRHCSSSRYSL